MHWMLLPWIKVREGQHNAPQQNSFAIPTWRNQQTSWGWELTPAQATTGNHWLVAQSTNSKLKKENRQSSWNRDCCETYELVKCCWCLSYCPSLYQMCVALEKGGYSSQPWATYSPLVEEIVPWILTNYFDWIVHLLVNANKSLLYDRATTLDQWTVPNHKELSGAFELFSHLLSWAQFRARLCAQSWFSSIKNNLQKLIPILIRSMTL